MISTLKISGDEVEINGAIENVKNIEISGKDVSVTGNICATAHAESLTVKAGSSADITGSITVDKNLTVDADGELTVNGSNAVAVGTATVGGNMVINGDTTFGSTVTVTQTTGDTKGETGNLTVGTSGFLKTTDSTNGLVTAECVVMNGRADLGRTVSPSNVAIEAKEKMTINGDVTTTGNLQAKNLDVVSGELNIRGIIGSGSGSNVYVEKLTLGGKVTTTGVIRADDITIKAGGVLEVGTTLDKDGKGGKAKQLTVEEGAELKFGLAEKVV